MTVNILVLYSDEATINLALYSKNDYSLTAPMYRHQSTPILRCSRIPHWSTGNPVNVADNDQMAALVADHMLKVEGITGSQTHIAFRVHFKHDLENFFAVRME
jgi:hypothetical protein